MTSNNPNPLRAHAFGMVGLLTLQYLLGMATNLFVQFPDGLNEGQSWGYAWRQPFLALHIIIGFSLFLGTVALIVRSVRAKDRLWTISSGIAGATIFAAMGAGSLFIPSQRDVYSFVMATCFIIALLAYGWGLYKTK